MIYLDHGATSMGKPPQVAKAMADALTRCGNPGRGGHAAAMRGARTVFRCRSLASRMFHCPEDQIIFTGSCTHGLNIALRSLVKPGSRVVISGFEHNAVTRTLQALGARIMVAGRKLFDRADTLRSFENALRSGADAAVFTHVSNVFGYILPIEEMSRLCRRYGVPFVIDGAQSAGILPLNMEALGASFIAMPGHKGLLGPQGTGLLLCGQRPEPLLYGGTGTDSRSQEMPLQLPEGLEAGTLNVPGIAGLGAALEWLQARNGGDIARREAAAAKHCTEGLRNMGIRVFSGPDQSGTVSFVTKQDCEDVASRLANRGIAVRAGLHCAPLAHESAGTLESGTVRVSFGHDASEAQVRHLLTALKVMEVM